MKGETEVCFRELRAGDRSAMDRLLPRIYDDLHSIAKKYMARERRGHTLQATALVVNEQSDVYSLGVVCYELITGRLPIGGEVFEDVSLDPLGLLRVREIFRTYEPRTPLEQVSGFPEPERAAWAVTRTSRGVRGRRERRGVLA